MGLMTTGIDDKKYARLLSKALPKVIENDQEFDRTVAWLERLEIPEARPHP